MKHLKMMGAVLALKKATSKARLKKKKNMFEEPEQ